MLDHITVSDTQAPIAGTAEYGALYEAILDAYVLQQDVDIPQSELSTLLKWRTEILELAEGELRGLALEGVPELWLPILRWAGIPLSVQGPLRWGTDIVSTNVSRPQIEDGVLKLPHFETLGTLTSLGMRPVRHFIGSKFGLRLQAANGISCYLWSNQAVLISRALVLAGGFLHGPNPGQRASLAIDPGTTQVLSWSQD